MKIAECLTSVAMATLLCAAPALAQEQKREGAQSNPPAQATEPRPGKAAQPPAQREGVETPKSAPNSAQRETPREPMKSTPQKGAQTSRESAPPDKAPAPKNAQSDKQAPQTQNKAAAPQDKSTPKRAETPNDNGTSDRRTPASKSADKAPGQKPVQLSSQQRVDVHRDVLKERNVNRVKVSINVNVGGRVPRNVHLAVLPAAIVAIVPAYRAYRYFVVDDRVYIVEPRTYEVVDVIVESDNQVADRGRHPISLTAQEQQIILSEVDLRAGDRSTLGLGALGEGSPVPRNVEILPMPVTVVEKVPRLGGFKYFIADERVAIVDPAGSTVQLLIDIHR